MRNLGLALWAGMIVSSPLMGALFTATTTLPPGHDQFCNTSPNFMGSLVPVSASGTCSFFTLGGPPSDGNARALAGANFGHVGVFAEVDATDANGVLRMGVSVAASETGTVTFTANNGQPGAIFVNFNISFAGFLNAGGGPGDVAQVAFEADLNGTRFGIQNASFAGDGASSCGVLGSFICNATSLGGHSVTNLVLVPLNMPVPFGLFINVNVGNFGSAPVSNSAIADFGNSLDLPIGSNIFNLPAGFTANSTDFNIVDNRLTGTGVPEPSTFYLGCLSILVFATVRLIRQSR